MILRPHKNFRMPMSANMKSGSVAQTLLFSLFNLLSRVCMQGNRPPVDNVLAYP